MKQRENRMGPGIQPWGTPQVKSDIKDAFLMDWKTLMIQNLQIQGIDAWLKMWINKTVSKGTKELKENKVSWINF